MDTAFERELFICPAGSHHALSANVVLNGSRKAAWRSCMHQAPYARGVEACRPAPDEAQAHGVEGHCDCAVAAAAAQHAAILERTEIGIQ